MLQLGGREFDVIETGTIEWDVTLLNLLQGCGLSEVTMHAGEDAEGLALRVYRTLMSSGAVFEILGCVLTPAGRDPFDWRPQDMRETAAFLRKLHTPEDKAVITSQIVSLVTGFFRQGLLSIKTFPKSSTHPESAASQQPLPKSAETSTTDTVDGP